MGTNVSREREYASPDDVQISPTRQNGDLLGDAIQQTEQTIQRYVTRQRVDMKRDLADVERAFLQECRLAGEDFYYAWGSGKDRVEGPSVQLCMAAARCWGNCAVDTSNVQDLNGAWVITSVFVDLETGYTLTRQFWQGKATTVYGKFDEARKTEMRFGIGQSKAARNVVRAAMPEWLIQKGIREAKQGVRERIEKFIEQRGHAAAVTWIVEALGKEGVSAERILAVTKVARVEALDVDQLVRLRGNLAQIQSGVEFADALFPPMETPENNLDKLADKLAGKAAPAAPPEAAAEPPADRHAAAKDRIKKAREERIKAERAERESVQPQGADGSAPKDGLFAQE